MTPRIVETNLISSTGAIARLPEPTLPEVAFAGRSNVGKSSLLNALSNRKGLFKVSNTPGRTRTIVHVNARLDDGRQLYLVDLPGYGYARVALGAKKAWAEFMHTYLSTRQTLKLVVILVDVRRGPETEELELAAFLRSVNVPSIVVGTKLDRESKSRRKVSLEKLKQQIGVKVIGTSATDRDGIDQLLSVIVETLFNNP
jgi:GTP-binding protein